MLTNIKNLLTHTENADEISKSMQEIIADKAMLDKLTHGIYTQLLHTRKDFDNLESICRELLEYRRRNVSNFQLEKLDDYLHRIGDLIGRED